MNKKMSLIVASTIATILTAYVSGLTFSNQAFAQAGGHGHSGLLGQTNVKVLGGNAWVIKGPGHPGLGYHWDPGHLGDVCLSCWGQALTGQQGRHP